MIEDFNNYIKSAVEYLNDYEKSKNSDLVEKIESLLQDAFEASVVKIWQYDNRNNSISLFGSEDKSAISLESSITQQAISKKSTIFVNHITSDKSYNQEIDNPLDLKIRAFMVYPVIKNNKTIGVIKFWREIKEKKVFTRQEESNLKKFELFWERLIEVKPIKKEELLELLEDQKADKNPKKETEQNIHKVSKKPLTEVDELEELKNLYEKSKDEITTYKKQIEEFKKSEEIYKSQYTEGQESLKILESEYEKIVIETTQEYQEKILHLKDDLEAIKEENKKLIEHNNSNATLISQLKAEAYSTSNTSFSILDENIEFILKTLDKDFSDNEYSYILFEMLIYALESKKGMSLIEDKIKDSKLVPMIIKDYYFAADIKVKTEKTMISNIVEYIESLELKIFSKACNILVKTQKSVPPSLVLDMPKVSSILYHLMFDLYQFIDTSKKVEVNLSYKDKFFKIKINGYTNNQNKLIKNMFKQAKIGGSEKDRLGLQLSRKITERLKGTLEVDNKDNKCYYTVTLPAQKIKM